MTVETGSIASRWRYDGHDACAEFFDHCLRAANPDIPEAAHVLEIGCAEFNWLTPAARCWPDMAFIGIDWRAKDRPERRIARVKADVRDADVFPPASFHWIVSISAIEHIGLGHYARDPLDPDGDIAAITNAWRWLKPGGWLTFDVPYDPTGYRVQHTECRVYDDAAIWTRLWQTPLAAAKTSARWHGTRYCTADDTTTLIEKPTTPCKPFHYAGFAWQKVR